MTHTGTATARKLSPAQRRVLAALAASERPYPRRNRDYRTESILIEHGLVESVDVRGIPCPCLTLTEEGCLAL